MTRTGSPVRPRSRARAGIALALLLSTAVLGTNAVADDAALPEEGPVTIVQTQVDRPAAAAVDAARLLALPSVDTGTRPVQEAPIFTGADGCPRPRCSDRRVPVPKGVQVTSDLVRVLLPTGYDDPRNRDRRYPVVFLWNGIRNDHDSWTYKTELLRMSRDWPAIFVMPAGGRDQQAGFFTDWADGSWDWETYHTQVVVPWVDRTFRTLPGARVSAGASMGGLGAIDYAARHPGMFRSVVSISAIADTNGLIGEGVLGPADGFPDWRRVWGDPVLDRANWEAHNPAVQVSELRDVALFITCGTGFSGGDQGDDAVVSGDTERTLWEGHRGLLSQLTAHDVPYSARVAVGGAHAWTYFDPMVEWALPQAIRAATG